MLVYIQILRLLAAVAVVAFHAWGVAPDGFKVPEGAVSFVLSYGGHGVDLFFVISGFIIFYATHRATLTPAEFLRRRVERIAPLYFVVTFAVTILATTLPATFGVHGWCSPRHILKSLAFIAFTDGEMPVVYLGWSLEYEMYFYLTVALLMALTRDVWRNIVMIFSALAIVGQIPGVGATLGNYAFFVDPMILEFVLGVIAASLFVNGRVSWPVSIAAACAIAAVLVTDPANRVIVSGIPSACLVTAAAFVSRKRINPSWLERALARLGDASYSIYLAQVQTVSLASTSIASLVPVVPSLLLVIVTSGIVVALGLLLNILVERPLLDLCRRIGQRRTAAQLIPEMRCHRLVDRVRESRHALNHRSDRGRFELEFTGNRCEPRGAETARDAFEGVGQAPDIFQVVRCQRCPDFAKCMFGSTRELRKHGTQIVFTERVTK